MAGQLSWEKHAARCYFNLTNGNESSIGSLQHKFECSYLVLVFVEETKKTVAPQASVWSFHFLRQNLWARPSEGPHKFPEGFVVWVLKCKINRENKVCFTQVICGGCSCESGLNWWLSLSPSSFLNGMESFLCDFQFSSLIFLSISEEKNTDWNIRHRESQYPFSYLWILTMWEKN